MAPGGCPRQPRPAAHGPGLHAHPSGRRVARALADPATPPCTPRAGPRPHGRRRHVPRGRRGGPDADRRLRRPRRPRAVGGDGAGGRRGRSLLRVHRVRTGNGLDAAELAAVRALVAEAAVADDGQEGIDPHRLAQVAQGRSATPPTGAAAGDRPGTVAVLAWAGDVHPATATGWRRPTPRWSTPTGDGRPSWSWRLRPRRARPARHRAAHGGVRRGGGLQGPVHLWRCSPPTPTARWPRA